MQEIFSPDLFGRTDGQTYQFDYRYDDTDTLMNELEEFYPYVEIPLLRASPERFRQTFPKGMSLWISHS
jgi:hypothetical protein